MQRRIVAALREGNYVETAAEAAGVGKATLYEWLQRFPGFADAVARARAAAELKLVRCVARAAPKDWRAAIEILQRTRPNRFALRVHHLVERELNAVLDDLERELEPDEFQRVARVLAGGARSEAPAEPPTAVPGGGAAAGPASAAGLDPGSDAGVRAPHSPAPAR